MYELARHRPFWPQCSVKRRVEAPNKQANAATR
jgi:hypothetical protein